LYGFVAKQALLVTGEQQSQTGALHQVQRNERVLCATGTAHITCLVALFVTGEQQSQAGSLHEFQRERECSVQLRQCCWEQSMLCTPVK